MLPDNLEQKVALLHDNPTVGFVHSNLMLIDAAGQMVAENIWNKDTRRDYIKAWACRVPHNLSRIVQYGSSFLLALPWCAKNVLPPAGQL